MSSTSLVRWLIQGASKPSLRFVLVVPFFLQVFVAVGLTGWLSFRTGSQAVNELANRLQVEVSNRILQELNSYLAPPHQINQINVDAIRLDLISLDRMVQLERYLWNQMQQFPTASYIGFGTEAGEYIGANRYDDGSIEFDILASSTNGKLQKWTTDENGNPKELYRVQDNYDPRKRPWYQVAVKAGQPVWTEVYPYFGSKALVISANQPIYDQNKNLLGVASTDLTLKRISEFLNRLEISKTGQTFVLERNGLLIATSTGEETFTTDEKTQENDRLEAVESQNPLTRSTAEFLVKKYGNFNQINSQKQLTFFVDRERVFLQVTPLRELRGVNWLIVVVVPERDFMERIHGNTRMTIILCLTALFLATLFGILTSQWISTPILRLSEASQAIASGKLEQTVEEDSIKELGILGRSFNTMSRQLRESFNALAKTNEDLEKRVEERTADLRQEKERSEQLLLNILPQPIAEQLKQDQKAIASSIEEVTILFADIVGFTPLSAQMPPIELVSLLNEMFSIFDHLAEQYKLEKIKTIGDAYMVVGGLPLPQENHAEAIADMALGMQAAMTQFQAPLEYFGVREKFQIRIGINTGSVVAGVIGIKKFIYDLWGDAVNIASRMESSGIPGQIQVTEATYQRLKEHYFFEKRGKIPVKGKGEMTTYWLLSKKEKV